MAKNIKAQVRPELLVWARTTAGYAQADASARLKIDEDTYLAWEAGLELPSFPQLRKVAELFKRPLAVFFLSEPPSGFEVMRDLRRLPGSGFRYLPPGLQQEIRQAAQRRELAIELAEDIGIDLFPFDLSANLTEDPEIVGDRVRRFLGISTKQQFAWKDAEGRASFSGWRNKIEHAGVLIFQATKFSSEDASGFAIWKPILPTIVINRKDVLTRRTFSLLHEFVHLMLRVSSVSDLETDAARPAEDQALEIFCNQVAASALMPMFDLMEDDRLRGHGAKSIDWSDAEISDLARSYGVSREAFVRRLLTFDLTTPEFYQRKRNQYNAEYVVYLERQKQKQKESDGIPRNIPLETISNFGRPFVGMVLGNYHQERLTLSEVSGYLGLKTKHLPKLEQIAGFR